MTEFALHELSFIRKHFGIDMTPKELARYFSVAEAQVQEAVKIMGLKYDLDSLTGFCSPYPSKVAVGVTKFSWDRFFQEKENGDKLPEPE